ncbi:iron ABC transporter permease [Pseudoclavibacter sp. AY1H1]|uniref:FecCD family ABC transporter permease n=2 Tax=unclassified Pseudoclavibacter TaxID=2615177 RepID=UPI0021573F09|nr:iron chelate uptake ABC transporter family permease subunit [Pseudoclavibacter sp. AY1H1]
MPAELTDTQGAALTGAAPSAAGARRRMRMLGLAIGVALLLVTVVLSVLIGAKPLPIPDMISALANPDGSEASEILFTLRIPRTVVGIFAGMALAVSGALMQALTRNPLADPGLLGVNAGAALAVALGIALVGITTPSEYSVFSFVGAVVATLVVLAIGRTGRYGASPARLVLAGVALAAVFSGISMALTMLFPLVFAGYRAWTVGSLVGHDLLGAMPVLPVIVVGLIVAVCISRGLGALSLGDDHARALGTRVRLVRGAALVSVTLLAGCATALIGPVAFIGLMIPHVVRRFTGPSQPWILASSLIYGPAVLLAADILGRVVAQPGEYPVAFMMAIIGAPVLIAMMARRRVISL